jgi:hypothetical protein
VTECVPTELPDALRIQPSIRLTAAVETASVIIIMMIASSFIKLSAISLIAALVLLVLKAQARTRTLQRACRPARARRLHARDTRNRRLFNELNFSGTEADESRRDEARPLSIRDGMNATRVARFETIQLWG